MNFPIFVISGWKRAKKFFIGHLLIINHNPVDLRIVRRDFDGEV